MMELKQLGNTGVMVPEIGLGTWKYRGGVEPLRRGIELGAYLIDTAEIYRTEDVVGQAIQGLRERVFLATKVSGEHLRHDQVLRAADASLRLLGTEVIDLYQLHWPNPRVPIKETMQAMETLVDRGQVRYIGVSNFSLRELRAAQEVMTKYPIVANQVLYNLNRREIERDLLPYCQEHNITILAYTPLDDGRLAAASRFRRNQSTACFRGGGGRGTPDPGPGGPELVYGSPERDRHSQVEWRRAHGRKLPGVRLAPDPSPTPETG